jgi:hypothetical protein
MPAAEQKTLGEEVTAPRRSLREEKRAGWTKVGHNVLDDRRRYQVDQEQGKMGDQG